MNHERLILGELPYSKKESEDAFLANYDKHKKLKLKEENAYHLTGETFLNHWVLYLKVKLNTTDFLSYIKNTYNASMSEFVVALIAYSMFKESIDFVGHHKPIKLFVPVNLRPFFNSVTLRNFSLYIKATFTSEKSDWTFEEMLELTKESFREQLDKEQLNMRINALVGIEKNIFIRMLPLILKNLAFKIGYQVLGENINTCSISNLGIVNLPNDLASKVLDVDFLNAGHSLAVTAASINDHTNIMFTTPQKDLSMIHFFIKFLVDAGLDVTIDTNYKEAYDEIL